MARNRRLWMLGGGAAVLVAAGGLAAATRTPFGQRIVESPAVGTAYAAELICSGVFVMGREPDRVMQDDIFPVNPILRHLDVVVDKAKTVVTASLFGMARRSALFRPGLGCTLVGKGGVEELRKQAEGVVPMEFRPRPEPWPAGDRVDTQPSPQLAEALDQAFAPDTGSRAIVVVKDGRIVAERYGEGFSAETRFLGWSMAKSVNGTLIGTLVSQGILSLDAPAPVPSWQGAGDGRQRITLRQLLTMTSGLSFSETYVPGDDATAMLYRQDDMAAYAATRPMEAPPGTQFSYSSGTANILSHILFDAAGGSAKAAYDFARTHLFEPAGMTSAVFQPDATGSPVGSSYVYMTARDWARFGLLYLGGGTLGWQRIVSADWVAEASRPAKLADGSTVAYGMQFWLNGDGTAATPLRYPHCPVDMYFAKGHNDQFAAVMPSRNIAVIRLGWNTGQPFDLDRHLSSILAALE